MAVATVAARGALASAAVRTAAPPSPPGHARFAEVLRRTALGSTQPPATHASPLRALESVERAQRRLDEILAQARSGRTFTGAELLALQAEASRFSHTVELASKVVEQGAQTIKQAVNTPI